MYEVGGGQKEDWPGQTKPLFMQVFDEQDKGEDELVEGWDSLQGGTGSLLAWRGWGEFYIISLNNNFVSHITTNQPLGL